MGRNLLSHFQAAQTNRSQRRCIVCVSHISAKLEICKNAWRAHGVSLTKSLIQNHQLEIIIIACPFCKCVWVFVCTSALLCVLYL